MTILAVDLFRGAGGWDVYDADLGIESVGAENNEAANATATAAGLLTCPGDVRRLSPRGLGFELLKASPPCQTFSMGGNGAGRLAIEAVFSTMDRLYETGHLDYDAFDDRTGLVLEPLRWAMEGDFRAIVLEQVPPVLPVWERMAKYLEQMGYSVVTGNLTAEQFGVPQTRKRAVLIATRDREARMPTPTHSRYYSQNKTKLDPGVRKWVSMAEALPDCPPVLTQWRGAGRVERHGNRPDRTAAQPAFTISGGGSGSGPLRWLVDEEYRRLSVQDYAVLQNFPADYPWQGTKTQQYLQVGNAIPPLLARAILETVL